jgi:hypothetical protein
LVAAGCVVVVGDFAAAGAAACSGVTGGAISIAPATVRTTMARK